MTVRQRLVLAVPALWLAMFFLIPFAIVLRISFSEMQVGVPPYTPLFDADGALQATVANYQLLADDALYLRAYIGSLKIAAIATLLALLIGYPMAYAMARSQPATQRLLLLAVMLPFWTSFLVRIYAWIGILRPGGTINAVLEGFGLIGEPLRMLNTDGAVYLGIVYAYLPFMVLPLYARLQKLDWTLLEAAADLGARPWAAFLRVTVPLSLPGILAGCLLVFIPAVGEFVIPELLGGPDTLMIGKVLWAEFFSNRDRPMSAAVTVVLLLFLLTPILILSALQGKAER